LGQRRAVRRLTRLTALRRGGSMHCDWVRPPLRPGRRAILPVFSLFAAQCTALLSTFPDRFSVSSPAHASRSDADTGTRGSVYRQADLCDLCTQLAKQPGNVLIAAADVIHPGDP